jgi:hypothetical protein
MRKPSAGYLLEKNPTAGAKIEVDVAGKGLKVFDFGLRNRKREAAERVRRLLVLFWWNAAPLDAVF